MKVDATFRLYDGRDVEPFRDVAASLPRTPDNVRLLLEMAGDDDERLRHGATWVLKAWIVAGVRLDARAAARFCGCIGDPAMPAMATVNLLQALPRVTVPAAWAPRLLATLRGQTASAVPFLRAWAYNGLDVLASQRPELRRRVAPLLRRGARDPAASVRARLRNREKER